MSDDREDGRGRHASLFNVGGGPKPLSRLPSSYATPAPPPPSLGSRRTVPLTIGAMHYRQTHEVCACSEEALAEYAGKLPYRVGSCPYHSNRYHYQVEPC